MNRPKSDEYTEDSLLGTRTAAGILRVDTTTVQRWIDSGLITGYRTPGGHRRILYGDLIAFARQQGIPLPSSLPRPDAGEESTVADLCLLVDDEQEILEALTDRIKGMRPDIQTMAVADGFRAGFVVQKFKPVLVLLDIRMPGVNGIDVCRTIKSDPETSFITVVGVTGIRNPREIEKLKEAGAVRVLKKPLDTSELSAVLDRAFPRKKALASAG